jgi:hypothetical protein
MKVIFWAQQGRMGNLIFQYLALAHYSKPDDILICSEKNIFKYFKSKRKYLKMQSSFFMFLNVFFKVTANFRLISSISPAKEILKGGYESESGDAIWKKGLISKILYFDGFYQSDKYYKAGDLKLWKKVDDGEVISRHNLPLHRNMVAVHLRKKDYADWSILGKQGTVLPDRWYQDAIGEIQKSVKDPIFIFFSDEIVDETLIKNIEYRIISGNSEFDDFLMMSLCHHAIISASSFSYWSAMINFHDEKIVIAPKYWLGFKSKVWYPSTIKNNKFRYI